MKKPSITVVLLVGSIQLIAPTLSSGCTIIPSLWQLAGSADLVVVARVVRIESDELIPAPREQAGESETRTVLVDVLEVWKGSPPADLRVTFQYGAPRDLVPGKDVLLFLERGETEAQHRREALAMWDAPAAPDIETESDDDAETWDTDDVFVPPEVDAESDDENEEEFAWTAEDEAELQAERRQARAVEEEQLRRFEPWAAGRWLPIDMSWAAFHATWDRDRERLAQLVRRAASLQSAGSVSRSDRTAWLVSASDHPATRGEALWQLLAQRRRLTDDDFSNLAASFVRGPAVDESDLVMLRIFAGRPNLDVDRAAAAVVEAAIRMPRISAWVVSFVQATLRRYGDDFSARIGRDDRDVRGRPIYTGPGENTLWTIWEVARRDLGIPEVPPAEPPPGRSADYDSYPAD